MGSQARPSSIPHGEAENITDCIVQHNGCFTAQWVLYTSSWCEDAHDSCTLHISCPLTECKYWSGTSLLPWSSKHREKWSPGTILYKWQSYLPSCYYQTPSVTWSVNKKYWQKTYFLWTWVWPCWSLILSPVFPLSCTVSVMSRMGRLQSTMLTAWSSCGSFTHIPMGAPNHKMLAGMQSSSQPLAVILSCAHTGGTQWTCHYFTSILFLLLLLWLLYYPGKLLLKILVLQPHSVSCSPIPKPTAPC